MTHVATLRLQKHVQQQQHAVAQRHLRLAVSEVDPCSRQFPPIHHRGRCMHTLAPGTHLRGERLQTRPQIWEHHQQLRTLLAKQLLKILLRQLRNVLADLLLHHSELDLHTKKQLTPRFSFASSNASSSSSSDETAKSSAFRLSS